MGTKHLSDVLSCQEIINEKNQKICIISGVGSGKNYFVENELSQYGNILYISSRRAKVNEILENEICSNSIDWENYGSDVVAVTNFGIQRIVQNEMFVENLDDVIKHFNFIVLDEAHSLCTDATFTDSSFHVFEFIKHVSAKYPSVKIIAMTGTPEPIQRHLNDFTVFDKRSECINVLPKKICIIDREKALEIIGRMALNEKTVYYSNSAAQIVSGKKSLISKLIENGFSNDEIGICMSDSKIKQYQNEYSGLKEKCELTKSAILKTQMLDEQCRILITTSSLKEGVNITNRNIHIAFCESHLLSDIQQFAGRIRNGLDVLYIISGAKQHAASEEEIKKCYLEIHYAVCDAVKATNHYLDAQIKNADSSLYWKDFYDRGLLEIAELWRDQISLAALGGTIVPMYIKMVEKSNQYLRFNHLTSNFSVYGNKFLEQERVSKILNDNTWLNELRNFAEQNNIEYTEKVVMDSISADEIMEYCESKKNIIWIEDSKQEIKNTLCYMMLLAPNSKIKTINSAFETYQIPYFLEAAPTNRDGKSYRGIRIAQKPTAESVAGAEVNHIEKTPKRIKPTTPKKPVNTKANRIDEDLQKMIIYIQNEIIDSELKPNMVKELEFLKTETYSYDVVLKSFYNCKEKMVRASWDKTFETSYLKFKYFLGIVKNDLKDNFWHYKSQIEKEKQFYDEMFDDWAKDITSGKTTMEHFREVQGEEIDNELLEEYVCEIEKRIEKIKEENKK